MYYVEFIITLSKDTSGLRGYYGISRKLDTKNNESNVFEPYCYTYCSANGWFYFNTDYKNYTSKCGPGTKIGMLFDLYQGSIKYYLNGVDKGYAVTNDKNLKTGVYYLTFCSY